MFVRSEGSIDFPCEYIEGYAYLQNKFYGHKPGVFYGEAAWLWMPKNLLASSSVALNYISARSESGLWIAFTNQSNKEVISEIELNHEILPLSPDQELNVEVWINNQPSGTVKSHNNKLRIKVLPSGITAIKIKGMQSDALFQQMLLAEVKPWEKDFATLEFGKTRAMIIQSGNYKTHAYVYLQEDDTAFRSVSLEYTNPNGKTVVYSDVHFPFEFTILLPEDAASFFFRLYGETVDGKTQTSELVKLYKNEKI